MRRGERLWLIVPLLHEEQLFGFVVLAKPRVAQPLDWENLELLRTAARQAASYLAFEEAAKALAEAQQFEGFNRLSAFVVHDLKNLVAQLSLVTRNAERHKDNPAFVDDAFETVGSAVERMTRLLAQLRAAAPSGRADRVDLRGLLERVVREHGARAPVPQLIVDGVAADDGVVVIADRDRLGSVIGNLIQNAQDATDKNGNVNVRVSYEASWVVVEITDNGCGMDETFVRERLFRPFDSTKGLAGMGIGAYECREFVNLLGGRVEVDSQLGVGTRFRPLLPPAAAPAVAQPTLLTAAE
jgi:putative PEP-CTERM system histidine kinase